MLNNNQQIGLLTESRRVANPTSDSVVSPVSVDFIKKSFEEDILINIRDSNLLNKIYGVNKMDK